MKRTLAAALVAAALPVLFLGATATPAYADCSANWFCLYPSADYKGTQFGFQPTTSCLNLDFLTIDNDANAMRNYRSHRVRLYDQPGCAGSTYTADEHSYDSNFGNNNFTNKASSLRRVA